MPGARLSLLRDRRPRAQPLHAAHDRREDPGATRAGRCSGRRTRRWSLHGTGAEHRPRREVDWDGEFLSGFDLTSRRSTPTSQSRDEMTARGDARSRTPTSTSSATSRRGRSVAASGGPGPRGRVRGGGADRDLEIDSHPDRLDLSDEHVLWARRHGVRFAVDTDAHAVPHLDRRRFGVGVAQRGWLTKDDVIDAAARQAQEVPGTGSRDDGQGCRAVLPRPSSTSHRPPRPRPGPPAAGWSRRRRGSWRWRPTSPTSPRATRSAARRRGTRRCSGRPAICTCISRTACTSA